MLHLSDQSGLLLRRDVVAAGFDDDSLRRFMRSGKLVRIRQGAYCVATTWIESSDDQRHRLLSRAVLRQYDGTVALSHRSAGLWWDCPVIGDPAPAVHVTSLDARRSRRQAGVVHHRGSVLVGDVTRSGPGWVTSPTRTALDVARAEPRDVAVCLIDDLLRRGLTSPPALAHRLAGMRTWPGGLHAYHVLSLLDGRAESPGESLARLLFRDHGLPRPISQLEIHGTHGHLLGRVDFAWPELGVIVEFDGRSKYLRHRRPGESIEDAVLREKRREDDIREATGWIVLRLTWADLHRPQQTVARVRSAFARRAA